MSPLPIPMDNPPTCPFHEDINLERYVDADGYTMFVCPECGCSFRADAWVKP